MKQVHSIFLLFVLMTFMTLNAQLTKTSWSFGFGFSYPRLASVDVGPKDPNYGAYLSLQRNFSEHVALRFSGFYRSMKGNIPSALFKEAPGGGPSSVPANWQEDEMTTTTLGGVFDVLYYFVPCSPLSPFLHFGGGLNYYDPNYSDAKVYNRDAFSQTVGLFDFGIGSEFKLSENWKLNLDFSWIVTAGGIDGITRKPDGYNFRNGIFGSSGDSYIAIDFGFLYSFSKGEPSYLCDAHGIADVPQVDYGRVESIIKKHIPKEVVKEVLVEKPVVKKKKWILVGVNFHFDSAELTQESYPVLLHTVETLLQNPDIRILIVGHSDNIGLENYNIRLSAERANTVKNYLISKGVEASRLKAIGRGAAVPIGDNNTPEGRAMNRRIEFIVLD